MFGLFKKKDLAYYLDQYAPVTDTGERLRFYYQLIEENGEFGDIVDTHEELSIPGAVEKIRNSSLIKKEKPNTLTIGFEFEKKSFIEFGFVGDTLSLCRINVKGFSYDHEDNPISGEDIEKLFELFHRVIKS